MDLDKFLALLSDEQKGELKKALGVSETAPAAVTVEQAEADLDGFLEELQKGAGALGTGPEFDDAKTAAEIDVSGALPKMVGDLEKSHRALHSQGDAMSKGMAAMIRHQLASSKATSERLTAIETALGRPQMRKSLTGAKALDPPANDPAAGGEGDGNEKQLYPARHFVKAVLGEIRKGAKSEVDPGQLQKARGFIAQAEAARVVDAEWFTKFGLPVPAVAAA